MKVISIQEVATEVLEKWIVMAESVLAASRNTITQGGNWPEHLGIPEDYQDRIDEAKAELARREESFDSFAL